MDGCFQKGHETIVDNLETVAVADMGIVVAWTLKKLEPTYAWRACEFI